MGTLAGLPGWAEYAKGSQSGDLMHFLLGWQQSPFPQPLTTAEVTDQGEISGLPGDCVPAHM